MFISAPAARNRGSGCGSTVIIMRSYSGRAIVPQMRAKERKNRCSGGEAIDLGRLGFAGERAVEGHVRQGQAAEIGDALAEHQLAVFVQVVRHHEGVKLLFDAGGALLEILQVLGSPPVAQIALRVVLAP